MEIGQHEEVNGMGMLNDSANNMARYGFDFLEMNDLQSALNCFNKALRQEPNHILALMGLRKVHIRKGENEKGMEIDRSIRSMIMNDKYRSMGKHDPLGPYFPSLLEKYGMNTLYDYLSARMAVVNEMISSYGTSDRQKILRNYGSDIFQEAYLLYYFPLYVEPIYYELSKINPEFWIQPNEHVLSVCYYGCGAAPELLGTMRFISEMIPSINHINAYFFDKYQWDWIRNITINQAVKEYQTRSDIKMDVIESRTDLAEFSSEDSLADRDNIKFAHLHIFQNCLRDIRMGCRDDESMMDVLLNTFHHLQSGSLMVLLDVNYGDTRDFLMAFARKIMNNLDGIVLSEPRDNPDWIMSNLIKRPEQLEFDRSTRLRIRTKYYSMVLMRT
jgi:tetratricopeptide (TPR) repeat protein